MLKKMIDWFNNLDKSIKRTIVGGIIVIVLLVIVVFILGSLNNRELSYSKLENKIKNAAITYYEKYPEKLPQSEGGEVSIDVDTLEETGLIKNISTYNDDNCKAIVYVQKNDEQYIYTTYLTCENYNTETLANYIKTNDLVTTEGDGLYHYNDEYIYRGENVNNYIQFSGKLWRIMRINNDNSLRIIESKSDNRYFWDNRYNVDFQRYTGINNFEVSRIKDKLIELESGERVIDNDSKKWVVSKSACLDKKDNINFSNLASLECQNYSEEKYRFLLPQIEEYYIASIDFNCNVIGSSSCTNYNYMNSGSYWSITPSAKESNKVYVIGSSLKKPKETNESYAIKVVTNLSQHVLYDSGDGSYDNPYTIQE